MCEMCVGGSLTCVAVVAVSEESVYCCLEVLLGRSTLTTTAALHVHHNCTHTEEVLIVGNFEFHGSHVPGGQLLE